LLLLLAAAAAGRPTLGVALVVVFGVGMATTLAAVGLVARRLLLRLEALSPRIGVRGEQARRLLGYGGALSVSGIGLTLTLRSVLALH
jgi:hypothetical protein